MAVWWTRQWWIQVWLPLRPIWVIGGVMAFIHNCSCAPEKEPLYTWLSKGLQCMKWHQLTCAVYFTFSLCLSVVFCLCCSDAESHCSVSCEPEAGQDAWSDVWRNDHVCKFTWQGGNYRSAERSQDWRPCYSWGISRYNVCFYKACYHWGMPSYNEVFMYKMSFSVAESSSEILISLLTSAININHYKTWLYEKYFVLWHVVVWCTLWVVWSENYCSLKL